MRAAGGRLVLQELPSSLLLSLAHVTGVVQAAFYGVPHPTWQVARLLETCETGPPWQQRHLR